MLLSTGTRLGPYEILAPLGTGGMGEVYRAKDTKLGREVAIKVLPEAFTTDPDRVARFRREAQTMLKVRHPNIVRGLEFGTDPVAGHAYLVMEYVDGPSALTLLEQHRQLPIGTAVRVRGDNARPGAHEREHEPHVRRPIPQQDRDGKGTVRFPDRLTRPLARAVPSI